MDRHDHQAIEDLSLRKQSWSVFRLMDCSTMIYISPPDQKVTDTEQIMNFFLVFEIIMTNGSNYTSSVSLVRSFQMYIFPEDDRSKSFKLTMTCPIRLCLLPRSLSQQLSRSVRSNKVLAGTWTLFEYLVRLSYLIVYINLEHESFIEFRITGLLLLLRLNITSFFGQ